jgi:hypothetical protein
MARWHGRTWIPAALLAATVALVAPAHAGPSRAAADLRVTGPAKYERWARASLMPTVGGPIKLRLIGCPALPRAAGCVYRKRPRTIYLKPRLRRPRSVLLHELGHLYDLRVMNNRDRGRFRKIIAARKRPWWRGKVPLAEQFAEAYSFCARYQRIRSISRFSTYDYAPTVRQHTKVCRLIVGVADDRAPAAPAPQAPIVTRPDPEPPPQPPPSKPQPTPTPTPRPPSNPTPVPTIPPIIPPLP